MADPVAIEITLSESGGGPGQQPPRTEEQSREWVERERNEQRQRNEQARQRRRRTDPFSSGFLQFATSSIVGRTEQFATRSGIAAGLRSFARTSGFAGGGLGPAGAVAIAASALAISFRRLRAEVQQTVEQSRELNAAVAQEVALREQRVFLQRIERARELEPGLVRFIQQRSDLEIAFGELQTTIQSVLIPELNRIAQPAVDLATILGEGLRLIRQSDLFQDLIASRDPEIRTELNTRAFEWLGFSRETARRISGFFFLDWEGVLRALLDRLGLDDDEAAEAMLDRFFDSDAFMRGDLVRERQSEFAQARRHLGRLQQEQMLGRGRRR